MIDLRDIPAATEEAVYILRALPRDAATAAIASAASGWTYIQRRALVRRLAAQIIDSRRAHREDVAELLAQDIRALMPSLAASDISA